MQRNARIAIGLAALAVAALLLFLLSRPGASTRALKDMPAAERRDLFAQERESFRTLCGAGPREDALERQCREKALFLLQFPECAEDCQAMVRSHLAPESPR